MFPGRRCSVRLPRFDGRCLVVKVDLHTHTSCSDGLMEPGQLLDTALEGGIRVLSVTDHDTLDGSLQAMGSIDADPDRFEGFILVPGLLQ